MRSLYYNKFLRQLNAEIWVVQAGIFLNYLGWGAVMPFEVIYLHEARGFSLGVAGLVVGTVTGLAVAAAPVAGPLIDRVGARATAAGAGLALAVGYAGLAFSHTPAQAFTAAVAAGAGNGALLPSQSALIAALVPRELRHRATALSRVSTNLGAALGAALGGVVAATGLHGFVALFLANAVSYLLYTGVLVALVREAAVPQPVTGGYRTVLRDRAFVHLALINVAVIGVGWGVFTYVLPAFARREMDVSAQVIGLLLFANALTVVLAQIPVARLCEGRRRVTSIAIGALTFVAACLLTIAADVAGAPALLFAAVIVVGVGECFHTTALTPLVADLAPPALRGRYMATLGLSWWLGLGLAPALGTPLLGASAAGMMLLAAAVALGAAGAAQALDRELPVAIRLTPVPR
jgi:MFS family permease